MIARKWIIGKLSMVLKPFLIFGLSVFLASCSGGGLDGASGIIGLIGGEQHDDSSAKNKKRHPGDRIAILSQKANAQFEATSAVANIPPAIVNSSWTQPGGVANNAPGHLSYAGTLKTLWQKRGGRGSGWRNRLTAIPLVLGERIFTMDPRSNIRALDASTGRQIWRKNLTPTNEKIGEGFGGGLAYEGGKIIVTTGFGTVVALNPDDGTVFWSKSIGVPIRSSPTAANGKVFFVTTEGRFYALSSTDGTTLWSYRGLPENASLLSNVSPAVSGKVVVVPYPSGDVMAFNVDTGQPYWSETLRRKVRGSSMANLSDPARPVISKGVVYAVGHGGRMIATKLKTGERIWTKNIQSEQTPWVVGDTVYVIDVKHNLRALSTKQGKLRWSVTLPVKNTKKRREHWNGPVFAGGALWLLSSRGRIVAIDPRNGQTAKQHKISARAYLPPIIASNRMYIYTDRGRLWSFN